MFGKNRANVGTATLQAFKSGQIEAALNAAGSAQKEFDVYVDSIEAKLNSLDTAFQKLSAL